MAFEDDYMMEDDLVNGKQKLTSEGFILGKLLHSLLIMMGAAVTIS